MYAAPLGRLDPSFPGRGVCDTAGFPSCDSPRAYAMVLAAEANRAAAGGLPSVPSLTAAAGRWLLDHPDEDGDGVTGWGLPFTVDAFGDGSTNAAHTEYAITLGIVMNALLDWAESSPDAPRKEILGAVNQAADPYLSSNNCSPSGLFGYSLEPTDLRYDCFNAAAYLAGQIQRLSRLEPDANRALRMQAAADRTANALIQHHRTDLQGGWFWPYTLQRPAKRNDLCHAAYIIVGIENYIRSGGARASGFDAAAVRRHLDSFRPAHAGTWHEEPLLPGFSKPRQPRLYGVGMALSLLPARDAGRLAALARSYETGDGGYATLPGGTATVDGEAFLLYGLSHFLFHEDHE